MENIVENDSLSSIEKLCLIVLSIYSNRKGEAILSFKQLSFYLSCSLRTAIYVIKSLEEKKAISVVRNKSENHGNENNVYIIADQFLDESMQIKKS